MYVRLWFCMLCVASTVQAQTNLIVIVGDDMDLQCIAETPVLDRLAAESIVASRVVLPASLCRPSLGAMISGRYPWETGVLSNDGCNALPTVNALPAVLADTGYDVRWEGKFWEPQPATGDPAAYGITSVGDCQRRSQFMLEGGQRNVREWIECHAAAGTPFALFAGPYLPHSSYPNADVPQRYLDLYPLLSGSAKETAARTTWLDDEIGHLLGVIADSGLRNNTIIVFFNDNGWSDDGCPSKGTWYDRGLATPLYIRIPGQLPRVVGGQFDGVRIYPTLLDLLNIPIPETISQTSMLDGLLYGMPGSDICYGLLSNAISVTHTARWVAEPSGLKYAKAMRASGAGSTDYWRFPPTFAAGDEWLFDGDETVNLLNDPAYADDLDRLRYVSQAWYDEITAPEPLQIIDNGDPGYSDVGFYGYAAGYLGDQRYAPAGSGSSVATWTFTVTPGSYRVSATWPPHANRATNSPFTVEGQRVLINQELAPDDFTDAGASWEDLANVDITGDTLTVTLSNNANEYVIADAIRIERVNQ